MNEILTLQKASELLGISTRVLADKARKKELPAHKRFGYWYFLQSELVNFIKGNDSKPEKVDFSVFDEPLRLDKQIEADKVEKPVKAIKSTKNGNSGNTYTRAVANYPEIVNFMLSAGYQSVSQTALEFEVSEGLVKKIRKGMGELQMI